MAKHIVTPGVTLEETDSSDVMKFMEADRKRNGFSLPIEARFIGPDTKGPYLEGDMRHNTQNHRLEMYNGSRWVGIFTDEAIEKMSVRQKTTLLKKVPGLKLLAPKSGTRGKRFTLNKRI